MTSTLQSVKKALDSREVEAAIELLISIKPVFD